MIGHKKPIIALCFESENELKFYKLEARAFDAGIHKVWMQMMTWGKI